MLGLMVEMRTIGRSDLEVFPLCLGGNVFGWTADRDQSFAVLDAYRAAGGNFVDTADSYSHWVAGHRGGESESIIGEWLSSRGVRTEFVVGTKVSSHPDFKGLSPGNIRRAAEASLKRLQTDYIDLYYTHWDDESVPVEEIMGALDELVRAGMVRAVGASNISIERLEAELKFSEREGSAPLEALQPHYNLVSRDTYEGERQRVAEQYGLGVMPYYGLASGFLTGKYRPETIQHVKSERAGRAGQYLETERGRNVLAAVDAVAEVRGAEPATVALAWLAAKPTIVAPIASARTLDQVPALVAAPSLELSAEEIALLDGASA
jgi:aryl-alcohol dehydrogenase-like predicted oxidoreductase